MCPEDRRGVAVCLTDEGRERYEAARPTHRQVLAETLTPPSRQG
jgi:DNA-binding MarR family transcriptional regulator